MAKISLHSYTREIENLIERGQTEEAIAHCKYILKQFPKHIDTYRLLGKTYLESQRYSEAADILQRVLSAIPDDFVAQLGMSIIREDEGNLDAAIWHMERAYEVQPANTALQDELRRLYGRRDGVEPPKVRLTRGALVRMYARGELFTQAIAEARAAIAEDPSRIDLEIILARMYYLAGMKVEATEVSSRLVSKLPNCLEANRILADILPSTARAEDAKTFQQNLNAIDPYSAFISPTAPASSQVPENAVMVERLDYTPGDHDQNVPQWAQTAGVDYQQEASDLPDWLDTVPASPLTSAPVQEESAPLFEETLDFSSDLEKTEPAEIPEWMREAGWGESAGQVQEEQSSVFDLAGESEDDLASAELPAWLRDMAPAQAEDEPEAEITPEEQERLDLLDSILPPEPAEQTFAEAELGLDAPTAEEIEPGEIEPASEGELPEWLSDVNIVEDTTIYKTGRTGALPSWLEEELETEPEPAEQLPDEDLPDWLRPTAQETVETPLDEVAEPATSDEAVEQDETDSAWLESLAGEQAQEEDAMPSMEQRMTAPPAWVTDDLVEPIEFEETPAAETEMAVTPYEEALTPVEQEAPAAEADEEPALPGDVVEPVEVESPLSEAEADAATQAEIDAGFKWLESLAEKQGAEADTLFVQPEDRRETPPEWVWKESDTISAHEEPPAEAISETEQALPEVEPLTEVPAAELSEDDAFAWLESLAAKQGADEETLLTAPEERLETPPEWVYEETGQPAVSAESEGAETGDEFEQPVEHPTWMQELAGEEASAPVEAEPDAVAEPVDWFAELPVDTLAGSAETEAPAEVSELESAAAALDEEVTAEAEIVTAEVAEAPEEEPLPASEITDVEETEPFEAIEPAPAVEEEDITRPVRVYAVAEPVDVVEEPVSAVEEPAVEVAEPEPETPQPEVEAIEIEAPQAYEEAPTAEVQETVFEELPAVEAEEAPIEQELPLVETVEAPLEVVPAMETATEVEEAVTAQLMADDLPLTVRDQAHALLDGGQIDAAVERYNQIIESGEMLDAVIEDLRQALDRHPVDISIWQTLGDAYLRNDQVQEALDSYTKAEELLR